MPVFSIPAFFIVLREVLEACLVVGIALAYINKIGATQFKKWIWFGTIAGVVASVITGTIFIIIYFATSDQLFSGKAGYLSSCCCITIDDDYLDDDHGQETSFVP